MFSKTLAAAAIVAPFFARTVLAGDCVRTVTVKEGDTCDSISAAENVSTYQFAIINEGLIDETCSNLIAGQDYCIGYEAEDCSDVWVVEAQQTCDDITGVMVIEMPMLQENNPQLLDDCSNLYVGEVLCVANSALHPPASGSYVPAATVPATATAAASATPTYSEEPAPTTSEEPAPTTSSEEAPATTSAAAFVDDGYDENDESTWPYCDEL